MNEQPNSNDLKWCDKCIYRLLKDLIIPFIILILGLIINSKVGKTERHLKMVELLNEKIEGDYQDIEYLNQLFDIVDPKFAKQLKIITDYRLIDLNFKDFNNPDGHIRDEAINDLLGFYKLYPNHIIEKYTNTIPDSIQKIGWPKAISIAKGFWLLGEWKGDSTMYYKVKSFENSRFYSDDKIKNRILETLDNFNVKK